MKLNDKLIFGVKKIETHAWGAVFKQPKENAHGETAGISKYFLHQNKLLFCFVPTF